MGMRKEGWRSEREKGGKREIWRRGGGRRVEKERYGEGEEGERKEREMEKEVSSGEHKSTQPV